MNLDVMTLLLHILYSLDSDEDSDEEDYDDEDWED